MAYVSSIVDLIGHTPLLRLSRIEQAFDLSCTLLGKLERQNPSGSVKDRAAYSMLLSAAQSGRLAPEGTVVEPTSGNTGVGLAMLGARLGYRVVLTMPDTMSRERIALLRAYGAVVELTPGEKGMQGAIERAEAIAAETNGILLNQFENPANTLSHRATAEEILTDLAGAPDAFVAGIGTGGTLTGVGSALKAASDTVRILGVEPASSPLLTEGKSGPHGLMGIGANFVPPLLDADAADEILTVTEAEAYAFSRALAQTEGILCGITSGAALAAAVRYAKHAASPNARIVVLLPDTGERYLSTDLFKGEPV